MFIIKKLNTHEDAFYTHKILGIMSLLNYVYRFGILLIENDMQLYTQFSMILLVIHSLLSLSSFLFKLSNVRNKIIPIIYPEFRIHNIIFALRSVLCCFSFYYFSFAPQIAEKINMCICFLTMIFADITSHFHRGEKTIRNMPYDELVDEKKNKSLKK